MVVLDAADAQRDGELVSPWPPAPVWTPGRAANRTYVVLSVLLALAMVSQQLNEQWSRDVFSHIAAIREFAEEGFSAQHSRVAVDSSDPLMTPFHMLWGGVEAATGWSMSTTLLVAGLVNLGILLVALRAFVRLVTTRPWAPVFTLVLTLVGWGLGPWRWSGFFNLNSIGFGLPYPSTFSTGIGLLTVVATMRYLWGGPGWFAVAAGFGAAATLLCHPFTAAWLAVVAAAFLVASAPLVDRRRLGPVLGAGLVGGLAAIAWPFFSLLSVAGHGSEWDTSNDRIYVRVVLRSFLAAPGVVALWFRQRRSRRDPLVLATLVLGAGYLIGLLLDRGAIGRLFPGLILMLHVAFADLAAGAVERDVALTASARRTVLVTAAVVAAIGLVGVAPGMLRTLPREALPSRFDDDERFESVIDPWEPLDTVLDRDAVVVTTDDLSPPVPAFGGPLLAPPSDAAAQSDTFEARRAARDEILADPSSATARRALERYGVTNLVVPPSWVRDGDPGRVLLTTPDYVVIALDP